jgi:signal transduction histidine kinase
MRDPWRRSRRVVIAAAALIALLLGGFAAVVVDAQRASRQGLEERFRLRSVLAADFVESFLAQTAREERAVAQARLSGRRVTRAEFDAVVEGFGFEAGVLLDGDGRVLHAYPHRAGVIGALIAPRYRHLRDALNGRTSVSDVVPSVVSGEAIVSVAVPYVTSGRLRVFAGAFSVVRSPITPFVRNAVPLRLGSARIVDSKGRVIAASGDVDPDGAFVATTPISATAGWRVELAAPPALLFAPISGVTKWVPWALFTGFALASIAILVLVLRLFRSQTALRERNREIERLMRVQQGFVATTSHELRTPLTSVLGYLDVVRKGKAGELSEQQHELLAVVHRNAERLLDLVSDLLLTAQLDAGELQVRPEPITLDEVARESVENAHPAAAEKRVELDLAASKAPVLGDRKLIEQVVGNLVSNAVKFTPPDGRVAVQSFRENGHAVVEVSDTGIGIRDEDQQRLFQRFFRASTALEQDIPGTGLGLAISQSIAELHGGRLVCSSVEGVGSTFRLELPTSE